MIITYVASPAFPTIQGSTIQYGGGLSFDIKAALVAGGGVITVDTTLADPSLVSALDSSDAVDRSGSTPGTPVVADLYSPVVAHQPNPVIGDLLVRRADGQWTTLPWPGSGGKVLTSPNSVGLPEWDAAAGLGLSSNPNDAGKAIDAYSGSPLALPRINVQDYGAGGGGVTNNTAGIRSAIAAAIALAASNVHRSAVVWFPRGTYICDFVGHTLLTAPVTVPASGTFVLNVADAVDNTGYVAGNTLTLTDPLLDNSQTLQTTVRNITVVSVSGNAVTCSGGSVTGGTFATGACVAKQGVDEGQVIFDLSAASNVTIEMDSDAVLDMSRAVAYDQGNLGSGYGPILFSTESSAGQTGAQNPLMVPSRPGSQFVDVGPTVQPNPADGSGSGNSFAIDTWAMLASQRYSGWERFNWIGEMVRVAAAADHATWVSGAVLAGDSTINLYQPLGNRPMVDPNLTATTLTSGIGTNAVTAPVADATALFGGLGYSSGFALIDSEVVYFWAISETQVGLLRGRLGTTGATHSSGASVLAVEAVSIDSEVILYRKMAASGQLQNITRGANGTTAASHAINAPAVPVPPPGRVYFRTPQQGGPYYVNGPDSRTTTAASVGIGDTVIDLVDGSVLDYFGTVQIDNEQISFQYRSNGRIHGCTRGVNGTAAATHLSAAVVRMVPTTTTLTSGLANSTDTSPVVVNDASAFRRSGINWILVEDEVIQVKSGTSKRTSTLSGDISSSDATIGVASTAGMASSGVVEIEQEWIGYTSISGNNYVGCTRGINGTTPAAHTSGTTVSQFYGFTLVSTAGSCRGLRGTTAVSHSAGVTVTQSDGAFLQPLTLVENVHIRGLGQIKGQRTTYPRPLYTAALGSGAGGKQAAITFGYAHNVSVTGISIFHTERHGVTFRAVADGVIDRIRVEGVNRQGYGNATDFLNACQNCSVTNSRFRNVRHGGIASSAGNGHWGVPRRVTFAHNMVEDCINACWETQNAAQDVLVESNTFLSSAGVAVEISNDRTIVRGNLIRNVPSDGIQVANLTNRPTNHVVEGNVIDGCGNRGIYVFNETGLNGYGMEIIESVIVHDNIVKNAKSQGIAVITASAPAPFRLRGVSIRGNTITGGDVLSGGAAGTKARIAVQSCDAISVTDNQITDVPPGKEAVYLSDGTDCLVIGNLGRWRTVGTATGILVTASIAGASANNNIHSNRMNGAALGLSLDNNCQNNSVRWNDFAGCTVTAPSMGTGTGNVLDAAGGAVSAHASQHQFGGSDVVIMPVAHSGANRIQTVSRAGMAAAGQTTTAGTEYLGFFTADQAITVANLEFLIGTVFGNALDSVQLGLYTLANPDTPSVAATLVARTAVTAGANSFVAGFKALPLDTAGGFPASYALTRGTRYALGFVAPVNTGNVGKLCMHTAMAPSGIPPYLGSRGGTLQATLQTNPTLALNNLTLAPWLAATT